MEKIYLKDRLVLGFSLGLAPPTTGDPPMNLVVCSDGRARPAGTCPMGAGAKIAIGGSVAVAAALALWLKFRETKR